MPSGERPFSAMDYGLDDITLDRFEFFAGGYRLLPAETSFQNSRDRIIHNGFM